MWGPVRRCAGTRHDDPRCRHAHAAHGLRRLWSWVGCLCRLLVRGDEVRRSKSALHGLAALAAVALFPTAAAADDWDTCGKQTGDLAIAACSRAIGSDRYTGESLARLYTARGVAYQAKGDLERAMEDFNESMRADSTYARVYTTRGIT